MVPKRGTSGLRERETTARPEWSAEQWIDDGPLRNEAQGAASRAGGRGPAAEKRITASARPAVRPVSTDRRATKDSGRPAVGRDGAPAASVTRGDDVDGAVGPRRAARLRDHFKLAESAFRRERYPEARRLMRDLVVEAPDAASFRELNGLIMYRLGRWKLAIAELEAHRDLMNKSAQNLPILADCYRALKRYAKVEELWVELREASPAAELVAEGRIVMAGAHADRGNLSAALAVMKPAEAIPRRIHDHHLRMWYVLGDLFDRAGENTQARRYFSRILDIVPDYVDVADRVATLGR